MAKSSDNTASAATDPSVHSASGSFFEDKKPGVLSDDAKNDDLARRAWAASCTWAGVQGWREA